MGNQFLELSNRLTKKIFILCQLIVYSNYQILNLKLLRINYNFRDNRYYLDFFDFLHSYHTKKFIII